MRKLIETAALFRKAFGAYWAQIGLILFLTVISSASEGIGISAVVPAFSFVSGGAATDTVSNLIKTFFTFFGLTYSFRMLLLFIAVLFVIRTVMLFLIQIITARIVFGYERDVRERLFAVTAHAGWTYLSKQKLGNLSQLLMSNATVSANFFTNFSIVAVIVTKTLAYVLVSVNIAPFVALFAIAAGAVSMFFFGPIFAKGRSFSFKGERLGRGVSHFVNQHILGMKTLKTMSIEEPVIQQANLYFEQMRTLLISQFSLRGLLQMLISLGGLVFVGIAFVIMYRLPGFQVATFGIIVYAINQIFTQIQLVQGQLQNMGSVLPYLVALSEYEHEARTGAEPHASEAHPLPDLSQGIEFSHVTFSYQGRNAVLKDVTFAIPRGSMVGIVGPSGTGKTTIADLLLRLYEPTKGDVLIDGISLSKLPLTSWRKQIGYVTQDIFLLNDTVSKNISFYEDISQEDIIAAAKQAHIHDFIESLPEGYATMVGDRGILLSGGQRQRIVLARILARKPKLLILDEATSSLDTESERAIQTTIEELHGHITAIVIAHRLSTVANADTIIVLDEGQVIETGTPKQLMNDPESYFARMSQAR